MRLSNRRTLLGAFGSLGLISNLAHATAWAQSSDDTKGTQSAALTREDVEALIRPHFTCNEPALWNLAVDIYQHCVLGKVRPVEPPFQHPWLVPGGYYIAQWIWDTTFVVDLLSVLPDQKVVIRGIFQNYWDSQRRWAAVKPANARGMVANFIAPDSGSPRLNGKNWQTSPAFSQAPLLAWGMERVFKKNGDRQLVREGIAPLELFHEWYWRERDLHDNGLICVGSYSGDAQDARYETYDHEVDLDTLKMTVHPTRRGAAEGAWYGDICIPANTAYLLLSEASLARMAATCENHAMADRRQARLAKGIAAMRRHMWSQEKGCFLAVHRDSLQQIGPATVGGFVPLMADVPSAQQAQRMAQVLSGPGWATPLPIPTVSTLDKAYDSKEFWRGDVWPAPNYQIASGLAHYGHTALAAHITDAQLDNAMTAGVNERYDSQSGKALGVEHLGMSGVVLTMALDGLTARHRIAVVG